MPFSISAIVPQKMWDYFSHSLPLFVLFRKSDFSGLRKAALSLTIAAGLLLSAAAASAVKLLGLLAVRRTLARICVLLLVRRIRVRCYGRRGRDINTRRRSNATASAVAAAAATTTSAAAAAATSAATAAASAGSVVAVGIVVHRKERDVIVDRLAEVVGLTV